MGAIRAQLEGLQVRLPQEGTVVVYGATRASEIEKLLWAKMVNTIMFLDGALRADNMEDIAAIGQIKGLSLNLVALLRDVLYQLQNRAMTEIRTREGCAVQMLSEQRINII